MSFLKKTNLGATAPAAKPLLGAKKIGTGLKTQPKEIDIEAGETSTPKTIPAAGSKPVLGAKKLGGNLSSKPKLGLKKETVVEEVKEEVKPKKTTTKKKTTKKKVEVNEAAVVEEVAVDESNRASLEEMDSIMRQIVAPTTELWEQEKKDVLDALNNIKVEQDMTMSQVKSCLANLDELNFEILPKLHDSETMYDGTKQNYDTVKAIAIAKGSGGNAEARKAEGILACKNFVTPSGKTVDLHQYMLIIEERYKFYQKIIDGINFKKYSLVNYNNALKVESKNA
jgi:hypothetical protein